AEGFPAWQPADKVKGLFAAAAPVAKLAPPGTQKPVAAIPVAAIAPTPRAAPPVAAVPVVVTAAVKPGSPTRPPPWGLPAAAGGAGLLGFIGLCVLVIILTRPGEKKADGSADAGNNDSSSTDSGDDSRKDDSSKPKPANAEAAHALERGDTALANGD